jgi:lycopene cyclase domain-containing protein
MKRYSYLITLILVFSIPAAIAGFFVSQLTPLSALIPFVIGVTVVGTFLDIWATRHGKKDTSWLWQFHAAQTLGINLFGVPIEEYLFYVASSVYVVVMWEDLNLVLQGTSPEPLAIMGIATLWTIIALTFLYTQRPKGDTLR